MLRTWCRSSCEVHNYKCKSLRTLLIFLFYLGSLVSTDRVKDSEFSPEMIFFTTSGRIGVISNVENDELSKHLTELQRNLATVIPGVGGTSHTR